MSSVDPRHEAFLKIFENQSDHNFSEVQIANIFTQRFKNEFQWVEAWRQWYLWTGSHWEQDKTLVVIDRVKKLVSDISHQTQTHKERQRLQSFHCISAIEKLIRTDRIHAATINQWDNHTWLLNTPDCTVDLRNGLTMKHDPNHHMSKITNVSPGDNCPTWFKFLKRITDNNFELEAYLCRMAGYILTGTVREHAFFLLLW